MFSFLSFLQAKKNGLLLSEHLVMKQYCTSQKGGRGILTIYALVDRILYSIAMSRIECRQALHVTYTRPRTEIRTTDDSFA